MRNVTGIILAAGLSSRMGEFKPLLPYKNKKVINILVETIISSSINEILLIVGYNEKLIRKEVINYNINIIYNPEYNEGMHTSVMCGVNNVAKDIDSFMIFLADQPQISINLINKLIYAQKNTDKGIIIPTYSERKGHPILLNKKYIQLARQLNPDKGLKGLIDGCSNDIEYLSFDSDEILFDIDTPNDYEIMLKKYL